MPLGFDTFSDALRCGVRDLSPPEEGAQDKKLNTAVGDEGGFAPDLPNNARRARPDPRSDREGRLQAGRAGVDRPGRRRHRVLRREDEEVHDRRQARSTRPAWSTCWPAGSRSIRSARSKTAAARTTGTAGSCSPSGSATRCSSSATTCSSPTPSGCSAASTKASPTAS